MLLWFFMFLQVLHHCLHIWRMVISSSFYWLPSAEKYLLSALLGILRFSQIFSISICLCLCLYLYLPALHFLFALWGEFLRLYAFSWCCKGWVLAASSLLSLRLCWMIRFVYFLPILQHWASFLHMFTSLLQRLMLATLKGMCRLAVGYYVCMVEMCGALGECPWASWSSGKVSPAALGQASHWSPWSG